MGSSIASRNFFYTLLENEAPYYCLNLFNNSKQYSQEVYSIIHFGTLEFGP
jgi:hypothetical protein